MSRIIFTDKDEFLLWAKKHCTPGQYEVYITSFAEIMGSMRCISHHLQRLFWLRQRALDR